MFEDFEKDATGVPVICSEYTGEFSEYEIQQAAGILKDAGFDHVAFHMIDAFRAYVHAIKWA